MVGKERGRKREEREGRERERERERERRGGGWMTLTEVTGVSLRLVLQGCE